LGDKDHIGGIRFSSHDVRDTWYLYGLSLVIFVSVRFLYFEVTVFSLFIFHSLKMCHEVRSILNTCLPVVRVKEEWRLKDGGRSIYIYYLEFFVRKIYVFSPFVCLFSNLIISVWTSGYLFYTLGYI